MSFQQVAKAPQPTVEQAASDAQYYRRVRHDLIDMGTDLARLVHSQAKSQAEPATAGSAQPPAPGPDRTIAFDRVARTIHRTIALARKVAEPLPAPAARHPAQTRIAARKRILREVEDTIRRNADESDAETLHEELLERLDAPDLDDEIDSRPIPEIIADICRDLGIAALPGSQPWKRRTPAEIATLRARAARPSAARVLRPTPRAAQNGTDPPSNRPECGAGPGTSPAGWPGGC